MLTRFGISLENNLLKDFDKLISEKGYKNRSEAIRDLIREMLIKEEWKQEEKTTAGVLIIVYDHHQGGLAQKMASIQHSSHDDIISTMHAHLDHHNCLEVILLKGAGEKIKTMAETIISTKGVKFGKFVPATIGRDLH